MLGNIVHARHVLAVVFCLALGACEVLAPGSPGQGPSLTVNWNGPSGCQPHPQCAREMTPEEMERIAEALAQFDLNNPGCSDVRDWLEAAFNRGDIRMYDFDDGNTGDWHGCTVRCQGQVHLRSGLSDADFRATLVHEGWHDWQNGGSDAWDSEVWEFENNGYCLSW